MSGAFRREWRRRADLTSSPTAAVGTLVLHGLAVGVMFAAPPLLTRSQVPVYRVELVAAPRVRPEERRAPETVERPAEQRVPISERRPRRTTVAETAPPPEPVRETEREPAPRTTPEEQPLPEEEPSTGADVATVKTSGVVFPYPEYLENIVAQVYRRWNRPHGNVSLRAEVMFFIHRDGSISNVQFVVRSGSFAFDLEAQGAIEQAGNQAAFGPLPEGYTDDILAVRFFFDPTSRR